MHFTCFKFISYEHIDGVSAFNRRILQGLKHDNDIILIEALL